MRQLSTNKQQRWFKAAEDEMDSHKENETWELCDLPPGKKPIGCKWVFKLKYETEGNVCRYKTRLVAKGYTQKFGEDYEDTFAPVARYPTVRTVLTVAASKTLKVRHYDVKTVFLKGRVEEELYMSQQEGFIKAREGNKVCRLRKAVYGLKQSANRWNHEIDSILKENRFEQSQADPCLYIKRYDDELVYILLYVDDLLICGNIELIEQTADVLNQHFEIKSLGEVSQYLGIEIKKNQHGNYVSDQQDSTNYL